MVIEFEWDDQVSPEFKASLEKAVGAQSASNLGVLEEMGNHIVGVRRIVDRFPDESEPLSAMAHDGRLFVAEEQFDKTTDSWVKAAVAKVLGVVLSAKMNETRKVILQAQSGGDSRFFVP